MSKPKKEPLRLAVSNTMDFLVEDDLPPHVPAGTYDVMLDKFQTALMFKGKAHKLILWFTVVSHGEFYGLRIPRYYNVKQIIGKAQVGGRFKVSPKGDFLREYYRLFQYGGNRLDRLPMSLFHGATIRAEIETVKYARGSDIPKPLRYSKISRLVKVIER